MNNKNIRYSLNYPVIKSKDDSVDFINYINKVIYQDIVSFKDVVENDLNIFGEVSYIIHGITEYKVTFDKNNIISIPIEFSQLMGLYDISYINVYNYDLNLKKEVCLRDIFDDETDYIDMINNTIKNEIKNKVFEVDDYNEEIIKELDDFMGIYDNQIFYIEEDGIVICFSSYELGNNFCNSLEFKFKFDECRDYLSEYTNKRIYLREDELNEATSSLR